jgi:hypothetical protein
MQRLAEKIGWRLNAIATTMNVIGLSTSFSGLLPKVESDLGVLGPGAIFRVGSYEHVFGAPGKLRFPSRWHERTLVNISL